MKYKFIEKHRSEFLVEKMCEVLKVSRSGYYRWKKKPVSDREQEDERIVVKIRESHSRSKERYGSPRITRDLRADEVMCGENRVARLMRENEIVAKTKRKFKVTTDSEHKLLVADNLLKGDFTVSTPNRVWVSDITYIWTREGWLYLLVILDLFSRNIVGWSLSTRLKSELVTSALKQAVGRRNPADGLILHSDRGCQYASQHVLEALKKYGMVQSMSRKGNCYDNAVAESFFHTLKTELVYGQTYSTRDKARQSIFEYIEIFYNRQRRHSYLGYLSPLDFEQMLMAA